MEAQPVKSEPAAADSAQWSSLGTPAAELRLEWTLPTGQSFRWRQTGEGEYTGLVGRRAVIVRQLPDDVQYRVVARGEGAEPAGDAAALADYFNLSHSLAALAPGWRSACARFAAVHPLLPGARMLRQDPVECLFQVGMGMEEKGGRRFDGLAETLSGQYGPGKLEGKQRRRQAERLRWFLVCLFQFICSSNNHISRIGGMVERLCRRYGTPLLPAAQEAGLATTAGAPGAAEAVDGGAAAAGGGSGKQQPGLELYAFPTLEQLAAATEEELRADGFGYRAKYITGSVAQLLARPEGGAAWLHSLRSVPYEEASEALCKLPGIGPKVAACVCLFSLDKHEAIPVDTHVWDLACKYYTPHLRNKSLTKKIHVEVQAAFVERFGPFAGWAHNTLFISELASTQAKVPGLAAAGGGRSGGKRKAKGGSNSEDSSEDYSEAAASEPSSSDAGAALPDTPPGVDEAAAAGAGRPARRPRRRAAAVSQAEA
ncbi:hypothetical protein COHA_004481 [Chlorella ohadii]|uniref:DNA-(apurinic or apyrimidinic site) lyase n=1 Tax=Chlorella ohadii TaxID=2649997 RepID=A0AAD5H2N9_9CHLO|nr:hypothetical protein COHA_004481 [Chlorella ohadii]